MTDDEIKQFKNKAIISARKLGLGEHAEDIAQEVVAKFASGQGRHQTVDQAVIDVARGSFGDSRYDVHQQRRNLTRTYESLDIVANADRYGSTQSHQFDYPRIIDKLKSIERAIIVLRYEWGFKETEIAHCFGVTESRISQRLTRIQIGLRYGMAAEEQGEAQGVFAQKFEEEDCSEEIRSEVARSTELKMARVLQKAMHLAQGVECPETDEVEKEEPREVESTHEACFDEWLI